MLTFTSMLLAVVICEPLPTMPRAHWLTRSIQYAESVCATCGCDAPAAQMVRTVLLPGCTVVETLGSVPPVIG